MFAGLAGDMYVLDEAESVVQFSAVDFVATLNGTTTRRNLTVPCWDPLHILRDRQQIEPRVILNFATTMCNTTRRI